MIGPAVLVLGHEGYARISAADRASLDPVHDCFIALIGLGLGALVRHTADGICALVFVLFVLPLPPSSPCCAATRPPPSPPAPGP